MSRQDVFTVEGNVIAAYPEAKFKVKLENGQEVVAQASGKMRKNMIKIIIGDKVKVEFSVYDVTNGRIIWREHVEYAVI